MIREILVVALAVLVLVLLVREFADTDPLMARNHQLRWHLDLGGDIALACGMMARIASELRPDERVSEIAVILTLAGVALRIAFHRRPGNV